MLKQSLGFEIIKLEHLITRKFELINKSHGTQDISAANACILDFLYDNEGTEIFQRDIEKKFNLARSTVTSILQLMEKKGHITRNGIKTDGRVKKITMTPLGREINKKTRDMVIDFENTVTSGLTANEIESFIAIAEKIKKNVQ